MSGKHLGWLWLNFLFSIRVSVAIINSNKWPPSFRSPKSVRNGSKHSIKPSKNWPPWAIIIPYQISSHRYQLERREPVCNSLAHRRHWAARTMSGYATVMVTLARCACWACFPNRPLPVAMGFVTPVFFALPLCLQASVLRMADRSAALSTMHRPRGSNWEWRIGNWEVLFIHFFRLHDKMVFNFGR